MRFVQAGVRENLNNCLNTCFGSSRDLLDSFRALVTLQRHAFAMEPGQGRFLALNEPQIQIHGSARISRPSKYPLTENNKSHMYHLTPKGFGTKLLIPPWRIIGLQVVNRMPSYDSASGTFTPHLETRPANAFRMPREYFGAR